MIKTIAIESLISDFYCQYECGSIKKDNFFFFLEYSISKAAAKCSELIDMLESNSNDIIVKGMENLVYFVEGNINLTADCNLMENIKRNAEIVVKCGGFTASVQRLAKVLDDLNSVSVNDPNFGLYISHLHKSLSLCYILNVCHLKSVECSQQLARYTNDDCSPLTLLLSVLQEGHTAPGFPTKRILLFFYVWVYMLTGCDTSIDLIKENRRQGTPVLKSRDEDIEFAKSILEDTTDKYYRFKRKVNQERLNIIRQHLHVPFAEQPVAQNKKLKGFCERHLFEHTNLLYDLLHPKLEEYMGLFCTILNVACASSLHAQDKAVFFSTRCSQSDKVDMATKDSPYWTWIKREKDIAVKIVSSILLLLLKRLHLNSIMKCENVAQVAVDHDVVQIALKFLNKDIVRYMSMITKDDDPPLINISSSVKTVEIKNGDVTEEYSVDHGLIVSVFLRLILRLCKQRRTMIKNVLVRSNFVVCLKRVLDLPFPELRQYALKLIRLQIRYLGEQWIQKNMALITCIYCNTRSDIFDNWLELETTESSAICEKREKTLRDKMKAFQLSYSSYVQNTSESSSNPVLALQNRDELQNDELNIDGGAMRRFLHRLPLEENFRSNYEAWLEQNVYNKTSDIFPIP